MQEDKIINSLEDHKEDNLVQEDKIINSLEDHKEDNLVQEDQNVDFSLNFSVTNKVSEEIEVIQKEGEKESQFEIDENNVDPQFKKNKRSEELKKKLKSFNYKINASKEVITQLENQPAFERQGIELEDVPHSSESKISKYTLTDPEEKGETPEIRPNNSFLHDNVD